MTFSEMKKWAMDHLKKQMKDEPKESETFKKSIDMLFNMIQKSRGLPVGTIREWKGNKYKKMPNNHWVRVYDKSSRGANHAIAAVLRKIETCQDETELYNIIQANIGRFSDANGIPLPEVEKIHKASYEKKGKFSSGEKNESEKTTIVSQEELRSLSDKLLNKRFKELGEIIPTLKDDKVRREYNENYKNFQKEIERREAESEKKESGNTTETKQDSDKSGHNKVSKKGNYYTFDGFPGGIDRSFTQEKNVSDSVKNNIKESVKRFVDYVDNDIPENHKKVAKEMINNADKFKKMKREDFESETGVPLDELKQVLDAKRYIEFADKIRDFSLDGKMISKQAEQTFDRIVYPANLARELEDNILPDQIQEIIDSKAKKTVKKSFAEQVEEIRKSMIV